jgi:hypothetical protein
MSISVSVDVRMEGLDNLIKAAGPSANVGFARALNKAGAPTKTRYLRQARKILGIRKHPLAGVSAIKAVEKSTSVRRANPSNLEFSLSGWGKGLNLIHYQPKETPAGLNVFWLGARKVIPRTFLHGGRFPKRRGGMAVKSGVAFGRHGSGRFAISAKFFGPGLPEAMIAPEAQSVWNAEARARLPKHLAHELEAILMGHVSGGWGRAR